ncbi:uncharacterized protein LOC135497276 [Lineus longissimus]|uniref:uncharacterized protein LOC135497276 n=1 Tax=Lineus longissimus TaxID=88925 RepID=UPI002B4D33BE
MMSFVSILPIFCFLFLRISTISGLIPTEETGNVASETSATTTMVVLPSSGHECGNKSTANDGLSGVQHSKDQDCDQSSSLPSAGQPLKKDKTGTSETWRIVSVDSTTIYACGNSTCENQCENEKVVYSGNIHCSCRTTCKLTGRCCYDFEKYCGTHPDNNLVDTVQHYKRCQLLKIGKYALTDDRSGLFATVATCPTDTSREIADKCEGEISPEKIGEILPYVPLTYGEVLFANSYCLFCCTGIWMSSNVQLIIPSFRCGFLLTPTTLTELVFRHCFKDVTGFNASDKMKTCAKSETETCMGGFDGMNDSLLCEKYYAPVIVKNQNGDDTWRKVFPYSDSRNHSDVSCSDGSSPFPVNDTDDGDSSHKSLVEIFATKDDGLCPKDEYVDIQYGGCRRCPMEDLIDSEICARDYKLYAKVNMSLFLMKSFGKSEVKRMFIESVRPAIMYLGEVMDVIVKYIDVVCQRQKSSSGNICNLTLNAVLVVYRSGKLQRILDLISRNVTRLGFNLGPNDSVASSIHVSNQDQARLCHTLQEYQNGQFSLDGSLVVINSSTQRYHLSNQEIRYTFLASGEEMESKVVTCEYVKTTLDYLSEVLLSLSLFGLAAVFVTHCVHKEIRNQPGQNLMSLCPNLFLAYLFLLLGPLLTHLHIVCSVLAVAQHFFWLTSFAWMSVIAANTWNTFRPDSIKTSQVASVKSFVKGCLYAYGSPALVVTTSVIVTFTVPELGFSYGDRKKCWLGNFYQKIITFLVPVGILCTIKLTLFVLTVVNIVKVRKVTAKVQTKSSHTAVMNFLPYVKLSVILGTSWALGFLAEHDDSQVLRYVFVILNGSQGILLAAVFFSNARIRHLWRMRFCKKSERSSGYTHTTSGKIASMSASD